MMTGRGLASGAQITRIDGLAVEMARLGHHHHGVVRVAIAIVALLVLLVIVVLVVRVARGRHDR
jgi:hypothetical protein